MADPNAIRYWTEDIDSGQHDQNEKVVDLQDGEIPVTLTLGAEDLITIEDALRRRFIAVKKGRFDVVRAVLRIRKAMRDTLRS
jgi:hypothetical protein